LESESSITSKDMSKLVALYCEARGIGYASNDGLAGKAGDAEYALRLEAT